MSLWMPFPRRSSDMHWAALLQKLFALLEPAVPTDLRGVLESMAISPESIDELIRRCDERELPDDVVAAEGHFIMAYTSEEPAIYEIISRVFNDVSGRLLSETTVDDVSTENMRQVFRPELLACAGFYIRLQQALHHLPPRFTIRGDFYRGVTHKYDGASLNLFEGRLISMFTPKSTSKNRDIALRFAQDNNGTLFTFKNACGWNISEFSFFQREEEVVIGMFNDFTGEVCSAIGIDEIVLQAQDPLTLCVLGVTGHGKSESLNTLTTLRKASLFNTLRIGLNSCTQELRVENMPWLGSGATVRFVDTPGLSDTQGKDPLILGRIQNDITQKVRHVDAFAVVIKYSPTFDNHVKSMLRSYHESFGEDFINHLVIVVTHWDYDDKSAKKYRKNHLGDDGLERYERETNAILQEVLHINKQFNFVYLDNECEPQEDETKLHKQLTKLWSFMNDKAERFDGHEQESVYYRVVDDVSSFKCNCPGCDIPSAQARIWKVCTHRSCQHFGNVMHFHCWNRVHQGSTCAGKVLCERTFADKHAEHLPLFLNTAFAVSGANAMEVMAHAWGDITAEASCRAVDVLQLCVSEHAAPGLSVPIEMMLAMIEGTEFMTDLVQHSWVHCVEVAGAAAAAPVLGGVLGATVAWYMYKSKRQEAYDQLVDNYNDPKSGLSPESFAMKTIGAYRAMQARLGTVMAAGAIGTAIAIAGAATWGFVIGFGLVTCFAKWGLGEVGTRWGEGEVQEAFKRSHWQIVAQSLHGLELITYINTELNGDVTKLSWDRVKSNYHFLALRYHPDKVLRMKDDVEGAHGQRVTASTTKFVQIQASYEILEGYHKKSSERQWVEILQGALSVSSEPCSDEKDLRQRLAESDMAALKKLPRGAGVVEDVCALRGVKDKDQ